MDVWPTKWGVFHVGPKMKSLKEWLDDDPRNPAFADERRLKSISALLMKTAAKVPPLPDASGEVKEEPKTAASADRLQGDVEMAAEPKPNAETKPAFDANGNDTKPFSDAFDVFGLRRDGYAALDAAGDAAMARAPDARARAQARDDAATALCAVIRFVLSGSTKFWAQSTQWLRACLNLCAALPDALGTGADAPAPGDAAGDRLAVVVSRVLPPLEAMLRASGATAQEWLERREAWFTGLRGLDDFDLRVPPKKLMSVEDAERAVALAAAQAAEAIEWSTTESALASASSLSVARSARLLATLCSGVSPDPARLTSEQFLNATPPATHAATKACAPGKVVALVRKGMKLARERYLDTRVTPEGWIPLRELRPVERAVVRGVAYRAAVPAPPEWQGVGGTPPCVWVLLELLDPAMIMPGRRKAGEAPDAGTAAGLGARLRRRRDRRLHHRLGEVLKLPGPPLGQGRAHPDALRGPHRGRRPHRLRRAAAAARAAQAAAGDEAGNRARRDGGRARGGTRGRRRARRLVSRRSRKRCRSFLRARKRAMRRLRKKTLRTRRRKSRFLPRRRRLAS
jgi:hypothetical protein